MTLPNVDTIESYGGLKEDYGIAVVNSETDRAAADANRCYSNVAMATHTNIRAWVQFTSAATTEACAIVTHDALWGNSSFVSPTISRASQGTFDITWPAEVVPETAEAAIPINIRFAGPVNAFGNVYRHVQSSRTAANVLRIYTFDSSGVLQDFAGTTYGAWWV